MPKVTSFMTSLGLCWHVFIFKYIYYLKIKLSKYGFLLSHWQILKDSKGANKNSGGYFGSSYMPLSFD